MHDSRSDSLDSKRHLRWGTTLEIITLGWNVAGVVVLGILAVQAHSIALFGFGLDSLVEIGASAVVLWSFEESELSASVAP